MFLLFYVFVIASAAHLSELEYDNGTEETSSKAVSEVEVMLHHVTSCYPNITPCYNLSFKSFQVILAARECKSVRLWLATVTESSSIPSRFVWLDQVGIALMFASILGNMFRMWCVFVYVPDGSSKAPGTVYHKRLAFRRAIQCIQYWICVCFASSRSSL